MEMFFENTLVGEIFLDFYIYEEAFSNNKVLAPIRGLINIVKKAKTPKNLVKFVERNPEKIKELVNKKKITPQKARKLATEAKKAIKSLGPVEGEKEAENVLKTIFKKLLTVFHKAAVIVNFLNPLFWIVMFLIKVFAVNEKISLLTAVKRFFKFDFSGKWDREFTMRILSAIVIGVVFNTLGAISLASGSYVLATVCAMTVVISILYIMVYMVEHKSASGEKYNEEK